MEKEAIEDDNTEAPGMSFDAFAAKLSDEVKGERLSTYSMLQILRRRYPRASEDELSRVALSAKSGREEELWKS